MQPRVLSGQVKRLEDKMNEKVMGNVEPRPLDMNEVKKGYLDLEKHKGKMEK